MNTRCVYLFAIVFVSLLVMGSCHRGSPSAVKGVDNVATAVLPRQVTVLKPLPTLQPLPSQATGYSAVLSPPTSGFHLVGIASGALGRFALLQDDQGTGYTVRVGTRLGSAGDVVESIGMDDVVLRHDKQLLRLKL